MKKGNEGQSYKELINQVFHVNRKNMSHKTSKNQTIHQLDIPESLQTILVSIQDKMIDTVKMDSKDIENGKIRCSIGTLDKKEFVVFVICNWMAETMVVIENLNMILDDLNILGNYKDNFKGSTHTRFYLLVRTFFYEIYRTKEIFYRFIKILKANELIDKGSANIFKDTFHDVFKETIAIRNNLVHTNVNWEGREHIDLFLTSANYERGYLLADKKTGEVIKLQDVLKTITASYIDMLGKEGCRMRNVIQKLFNFFEGGIDHFVSLLPDRSPKADPLH